MIGSTFKSGELNFIYATLDCLSLKFKASSQIKVFSFSFMSLYSSYLLLKKRMNSYSLTCTFIYDGYVKIL